MTNLSTAALNQIACGIVLGVAHKYINKTRIALKALILAYGEEIATIEYIKLLNKARFYEISENLLKLLLLKAPENEYAKAYLALVLVEQHKVGWVELVEDLTQTAINPEVRQFTQDIYGRVAQLFEEKWGAI